MHPNEESTPPPKFATVVRGYDRLQVDDYVERLTQWIEQADYRAQQCETAAARSNAEVEQLRRRLASVDAGSLTATPESMKALGDRIGTIMQESFHAAKEVHRRAEDAALAASASAQEQAACIIDQATARAADLTRAAEDLLVQSQEALEAANAAAARTMDEAREGAAAKRDELLAAAQGEARDLARRAAEEHQVRREQLLLLEEHRKRVLEEIGVLHKRLGNIGEGLTVPAPARPAPDPPRAEISPAEEDTQMLELPSGGAKSRTPGGGQPTRRKVASSSR
ncbi:MAG TPA: hypothetical protein VHS57_03525 [Acidimicrobiales bacterium]|jgi:cell division septum initiation protein DivIVA|nr:hypothetical protein [Acidimicrobiales bacterium]